MLAFAPVLVAITPVIFFGWEIDNPVAAIAAVPVGVLPASRCLHLFNGLAWLYGVCARVMLGPSTVELRERVEGLQGRQRAHPRRRRRRAPPDRARPPRRRPAAPRGAQRAARRGRGPSSRRTRPPPPRWWPAPARRRPRRVKELRELARGIHPALLADRGLIAALEALAARAPFRSRSPACPDDRLPPAVEATAYFITAEALTNVAKYAGDEARRRVELPRTAAACA